MKTTPMTQNAKDPRWDPRDYWDKHNRFGTDPSYQVTECPRHFLSFVLVGLGYGWQGEQIEGVTDNPDFEGFLHECQAAALGHFCFMLYGYSDSIKAEATEPGTGDWFYDNGQHLDVTDLSCANLRKPRLNDEYDVDYDIEDPEDIGMYNFGSEIRCPHLGDPEEGWPVTTLEYVFTNRFISNPNAPNSVVGDPDYAFLRVSEDNFEACVQAFWEAEDTLRRVWGDSPSNWDVERRKREAHVFNEAIKVINERKDARE